ncbi:hypothetical protein [Streptomyces sp. NPDC002685]|uniref:hypothetical protein n=1 Tax=Streptomyces sp. NPDC002685 TaxID=3154540 RepID=UPI003320BEC9
MQVQALACLQDCGRFNSIVTLSSCTIYRWLSGELVNNKASVKLTVGWFNEPMKIMQFIRLRPEAPCSSRVCPPATRRYAPSTAKP